jgi:hypothetical protein
MFICLAGKLESILMLIETSFFTREDVAYEEKTSSASVREKTKTPLQRMLIGEVGFNLIAPHHFPY